jgi:hypothetical protein
MDNLDLFKLTFGRKITDVMSEEAEDVSADELAI